MSKSHDIAVNATMLYINVIPIAIPHITSIPLEISALGTVHSTVIDAGNIDILSSSPINDITVLLDLGTAFSIFLRIPCLYAMCLVTTSQHAGHCDATVSVIVLDSLLPFKY